VAAEPQPSRSAGTRLLFEDEQTRVWLLDLGPGEATDWHEHDCDYAFVVTQPGPARCEFLDGTVEDQPEGPRGVVHQRRRDVGHRLLNLSAAPYQNVVIEFKGLVDGREA
jgi:hypothetical protein